MAPRRSHRGNADEAWPGEKRARPGDEGSLEGPRRVSKRRGAQGRDEGKEEKERSDRVVRILSGPRSGCDAAPPEARHVSSGQRFATAAPLSLWNAVECGDEARVQDLLCRYRRPAESGEFDKGAEARWTLPFELPRRASPHARLGSQPISAFQLALRLGHVEIAKLLREHWDPPRSESRLSWADLARHNAAVSEEVIEYVSKQYPELGEQLNELAMVALAEGHRELLVRVLRRMILTTGIDSSVLQPSLQEESDQEEKEKEKEKEEKEKEESKFNAILSLSKRKAEVRVRAIHVLALEATSAAQLPAELSEEEVNAPGLGKYVTPVHLAALNPHGDVLQRLLELGGDPTIESDDGLYAINYAAVAEDGTETREEVADGENLPHFLAYVKPSAALRQLTEHLSEEAAHELTYHVKDGKRRALSAAIQAGRLHNAAWLLLYEDERRASAYYGSHGEWAVLTAAVESGDVRAVRLLQCNARFERAEEGAAAVLLQSAISSGGRAMMGALLDGGLSPLRATVEESHVQGLVEGDQGGLLEWLADHGHVDLHKAPPDVSQTALHGAVRQDNEALVRMLLRRGAPARVWNAAGLSVLEEAVRARSEACVEVLVTEAGLSLDVHEEHGKMIRLQPSPNGEREEGEKEAFSGWRVVLTGVFSVSKQILTEVVEAHGGKVQASVNGKTTHVCYSGRDGVTEYGQKMGKGDRKYTEGKRRRLPFIDEATITRYLKHAHRQSLAFLQPSLHPGGRTPPLPEPLVLQLVRSMADRTPVSPLLAYVLAHRGPAAADLRDELGNSPLHVAVECGRDSSADAASVLHLLLNAMPLHAIHQPNLSGVTPFHLAALLHKWSFIPLFFPYSPNCSLPILPCTIPNHLSSLSKESPVEMEHEQVEERLEEEESIEKEEERVQRIEEEERKQRTREDIGRWRRMEGMSVMHLLVQQGQVELVKKARSVESADLNVCMSSLDRTPLVHLASSADMLRELSTDERVQLRAVDGNGRSLLHVLFGGTSYAVRKGVWEGREESSRHTVPHAGALAFPLLAQLERWAGDRLDYGAADVAGRTPLHDCAFHGVGGVGAARLLLAHAPASLHAVDGDGRTPFAEAVRGRHTDLALFFLDRGASSHVRIDESHRALAYAVRTHQAALVYALLSTPLVDDLEGWVEAIVASGGGDRLWTDVLMERVPNPHRPWMIRQLFERCVDPSWVDWAERWIQEEEESSLKHSSDLWMEAIGWATRNGLNGTVWKRWIHLLGPERAPSILRSPIPHSKWPHALLWILFEKEDEEFVEIWLEEANRWKVDVRDACTQALVHLVQGHALGATLPPRGIRALLRAGANPSAPNPYGLSAAFRLGQLHARQALDGELDDSLETVRSQSTADFQRGQRANASQEAREHARCAVRAAEHATARDRLTQCGSRLKAAGEREAERHVALAKAGRLDVPVLGMADSAKYDVYVDRQSGVVYDAYLVQADATVGVYGRNAYHRLQVAVLRAEWASKRHHAAARALAGVGELYESALREASVVVLEQWGRIGEDAVAQTRTRGFAHLARAVAAFEEVFALKCHTPFDASSYVPIQCAYQWVPLQYPLKFGTDASFYTEDPTERYEIPSAVSIALRVSTQLSLIRTELRDGTNFQSSPQVTPSMVAEGWSLLHQVAELLIEKGRVQATRGRCRRRSADTVQALQRRLERLSNRYYRVVPQDFGSVHGGRLQHMPVLCSDEALHTEVRRLTALQDVERALTTVRAAESEDGRLRWTQLRSRIGARLRPLPLDHAWASVLRRWIARSRADVRLPYILRVTSYAKGSAEPSRAGGWNRWLFHATKVSNVLGIVRDGLRAAPWEAPCSGARFGHGVYLTDTFAKAAHYAASRRALGAHALPREYAEVEDLNAMFVVEVRLSSPPVPVDGISLGPRWARGGLAPDPNWDLISLKGVRIPCGPLRPSPCPNHSDYNEFILPENTSIRLKFLLLYI